MDKASHGELITLEKENLSKSMEQLRGGASGILFCVTQLRDIQKHNKMVEANNKSRSKALESKEKELQTLSSDLDKKVETFVKEKSVAGNLKKLVEELRLKKNELALILEQVKDSEKQLEMKSLELASKEKDLGLVRESVELSNSELELKKKMVNALKNEITACAQKIDSKSKESGEIQKLIEQQTSELVGMEKKHREMLETICRSSSDMEKLVKEIKSAETEASGFYVRSERFRQEIEGKKKELNLLKNHLELTLSKIEDSGQQLEVKEKRLQELNNLIKMSGEQLDLKSRELGEVERVLKFKRQMNTMLVKRERQPPISYSSQHNAEEETEPIDTFMPDGVSASLTRLEVSSFLRASPNRAEFVLGLVQDGIREGSTFQDTFLENLVLILEELAKIQQLDEVATTQGPELQLQATEMATLWKEKITIEAPKSSLEALAFLLFIVAYGVKTLINEEETALLASSIAHYENAPRLFGYLSLNLMIREFVEELIKKSLYIPAVRLICLFELDKKASFSFSPSELLKKEIISFRLSALENRSTESSQAKEKDDGRLRAILELVADYKLEIDLPGDLIAKLMVQGERSAPVAHCCVKRVTSSSNPQAELKKKQLGQTKTMLVKHTGVKEENLGTNLTADVDSSNGTSHPKHPPPVFYTYQRRGN